MSKTLDCGGIERLAWCDNRDGDPGDGLNLEFYSGTTRFTTLALCEDYCFNNRFGGTCYNYMWRKSEERCEIYGEFGGSWPNAKYCHSEPLESNAADWRAGACQCKRVATNRYCGMGEGKTPIDEIWDAPDSESCKNRCLNNPKCMVASWRSIVEKADVAYNSAWDLYFQGVPIRASGHHCTLWSADASAIHHCVPRGVEARSDDHIWVCRGDTKSPCNSEFLGEYNTCNEGGTNCRRRLDESLNHTLLREEPSYSAGSETLTIDGVAYDVAGFSPEEKNVLARCPNMAAEIREQREQSGQSPLPLWKQQLEYEQSHLEEEERSRAASQPPLPRPPPPLPPRPPPPPLTAPHRRLLTGTADASGPYTVFPGDASVEGGAANVQQILVADFDQNGWNDLFLHAPALSSGSCATRCHALGRIGFENFLVHHHSFTKYDATDLGDASFCYCGPSFSTMQRPSPPPSPPMPPPSPGDPPGPPPAPSPARPAPAPPSPYAKLQPQTLET